MEFARVKKIIINEHQLLLINNGLCSKNDSNNEIDFVFNIDDLSCFQKTEIENIVKIELKNGSSHFIFCSFESLIAFLKIEE